MIFIIRHGETVWNRAGKKQGRNDSPLTLKGINQAKNVARILKNDKDFSVDNFSFYMSNLFRVKQFASILSEDCSLVSYDNFIEKKELAEHSFGDWEGKTEEEIGEDLLKLRKEIAWDFVVPNGESYSLVYNRLFNFIKEIKNDNCVLVTHEIVSKNIRGILLNLPKDQILSLSHPQDVVFKFDNGKILELK